MTTRSGRRSMVIGPFVDDTVTGKPPAEAVVPPVVSPTVGDGPAPLLQAAVTNSPAAHTAATTRRNIQVSTPRSR